MSVYTSNRLDYMYKLLVIIALVITGTILARDIIIPIAFAAFLSIVLLPVVTWLEKKKVGTVISITLVLTGTVVVLGLLLWLLISQIFSLANDLPNLQARFEDFVLQATQHIEQELDISASEQKRMLTESMRSASAFMAGFLLSTTNVISTIIQIPIYIFLFLIYRNKFRDFFLALIPESKDTLWRQDIKEVVYGYVSGLTLVTLIVAVLNTIGLLALGIKHAIFFGMLSGILTIIPYVGIIIGALFPVLMALITKDSLWYPVGVVIVFSVVQFLEGNFITPRITGSKVSVNALAAIIALLLGGQILGISGMILAVPAIGALKIILGYTKNLKPFVILLEDSNEDALGKRKKQEQEEEEELNNIQL